MCSEDGMRGEDGWVIDGRESLSRLFRHTAPPAPFGFALSFVPRVGVSISFNELLDRMPVSRLPRADPSSNGRFFFLILIPGRPNREDPFN